MTWEQARRNNIYHQSQLSMNQGPAPRGGEKRLETPVQDRGTICQPGSIPQFCFLPGAQVQNLTERLQRFVFSSGCRLVLLIHAGISHTAGVTVHISRRTSELWWHRRERILLVKGKGSGTVGKCCRSTAGVTAGLRGLWPEEPLKEKVWQARGDPPGKVLKGYL